MTILKKYYTKVLPSDKYLLDEIVLAQAWKKSQNYIRRHNWYADVLELDCSTFDIENRIKSWKQEIEKEDFKTNKLKLVLAPKNQEWSFTEDIEGNTKEFDLWKFKPENNNQDLDLRPLAHISIRDQTFSTAVMICLADAIETAQGPTEESDYLLAQKKGIYSYGNRLHCVWSKGNDGKEVAQFGWGNSVTYRKYFDDYRLFLHRPQAIAQHFASIASPRRKLYIVSLDLSKFYEHIDLSVLLKRLKELSGDFEENCPVEETKEDKEAFWNQVKKILWWSWDDNNIEEKTQFNLYFENYPRGLPQGLVAGGFFANAYMVYFDRGVGELVNSVDEFTEENYIIRDYCRYVDDLRIVVEVPEVARPEDVQQIIEEKISLLLMEFQKNVKLDKQIQLNLKKTKITPFSLALFENSVSAVMNMYQGILSGTPDLTTLNQAFGGLEGLLKISEYLENHKTTNKNKLLLSSIDSPQVDVRDDTIKRFVANKMVKVLRLKRGMTNLNEIVATSESPLKNSTLGELLDQEFQIIARKLIGAWARNPSLTQLLKKGLDLYPDPTVLTPVIEALKSKLFYKKQITSNENKNSNHKALVQMYSEIKVAEYVAADLLFACVSYIGYGEKQNYPESVNIIEFREELAFFAKEILSESECFPWYLLQSAILFLISNGDCSFDINTDAEELRHYKLLLESSKYEIKMDADPMERLATSLVSQQMKPDSSKFITWYIIWMNKISDHQERKKVNESLVRDFPELMNKIFKSKRKNRLIHILELSQEYQDYIKEYHQNDIKLVNDTPISLLKVIQSNTNPFYQENAILLLIQAILVADNSIEHLSKGALVINIKVNCSNWKEIQNPLKSNQSFLTVTFDKFDDRKVSIPSWIEEGKEWIYVLGRIIRSCLTGEFDYTTNRFLIKEELDHYNGLRSTAFTRAFALNNSSKGLLQNLSPLTPWITQLLMNMLQWPGTFPFNEKCDTIDNIEGKNDLQMIIEARLEYQKKIFGKLSDTPAYIYPISSPNKHFNGKLKVVIVQTMLPQTSDFNNKDPLSWTSSFRETHRNHIASICNLVTSYLSTKASVNKFHSNEADQYVDLIVFPELSIHQDDIDLLRGLSDKTKAHIFTGLTFLENPINGELVNQGLWLLRDERKTGRNFISVYQGKKHVTSSEEKLGIKGHRPYQLLVEFGTEQTVKVRVSAAICYDATDLSLVSDLRDISDVFIVSAMNKDIRTFDNMIAALHYHMYQPVILVNSGEFGGSTAQAPYTKHDHLITHLHGNQQIGISAFEVDALAFKELAKKETHKERKTHPAGYKGRK